MTRLKKPVVFQRPKDERKEPPHLLRRAYEVWRADGVSGLTNRILQRLPRHDEEQEKRKTYQRWVAQYATLSPSDRDAIRLRIKSLKYRPGISVVMPVYNTEEQWLRRAIESVRGQLYPHWELCIADDCSTAPHVRRILEEFAAKDERVKVVFRNTNGHISAASNTALELATQEFVALLDHDDELTEHALYLVAEELSAHPEADLIYSDEDKINSQGQLTSPHFKTNWNPDLFYSLNFVSHLGVYRRAILEGIGGFRTGYEGSQDYDLALRVIEQIPEQHIRHIPHVLYHWRESPASVGFDIKAKAYAHENARRALRSHFERTGKNGEIVPGYFIFHRAVYPLPNPPPFVSLVIIAGEHVETLKRLVKGLEDTDYESIEVIIVAGQNSYAQIQSYVNTPQAKSRVKVLQADDSSNLSAQTNLGLSQAEGNIVGFVSSSIEIVSPDWLREMVSHAVRPEIGAVGARLIDESDKIKHAGTVLGLRGCAGSAFKGFPRTSDGYAFRGQVIQNYSAVSGDCLVMRRSVFDEVGGLDEGNPSVAFSDVDLCLRIEEKGYRVLWTPYAELLQTGRSLWEADEESVRTRGSFEAACAPLAKWGQILADDPHYNPNLSLEQEDFSLAWPPRATNPWK